MIVVFVFFCLQISSEKPAMNNGMVHWSRWLLESNSHSVWSCSRWSHPRASREAAAPISIIFNRSSRKFWFVVAYIKNSCTFWRNYCTVELLNYWIFLRISTKSWYFIQQQTAKKIQIFAENAICYWPIGWTKSQP